MKYLGYSLMAVVALIVLGVAMAWVSARMSLDEGYAHTQATAELPLLGADLSEGLVRIPTDRGEFRARIAGFQGEQERPLIILLHGFPVTSAMWLELIPPLAEAGYRVVAFDQRGYSPQVRPDGTANYAVPELVSDVFAVADAVGGGRRRGSAPLLGKERGRPARPGRQPQPRRRNLQRSAEVVNLLRFKGDMPN